MNYSCLSFSISLTKNMKYNKRNYTYWTQVYENVFLLFCILYWPDSDWSILYSTFSCGLMMNVVQLYAKLQTKLSMCAWLSSDCLVKTNVGTIQCLDGCWPLLVFETFNSRESDECRKSYNWYFLQKAFFYIFWHIK